MKINKKIEDAINKQINAELYSAYLYLGMSARCTETNLKGMANWFYVQAQEEMTHAMKFYRFVLERGGHSVMPAIEGVRSDWGTPLEMFAAAYEHEQKVTALINNIVDIALAERDHYLAVLRQHGIDPGPLPAPVAAPAAASAPSSDAGAAPAAPLAGENSSG